MKAVQYGIYRTPLWAYLRPHDARSEPELVYLLLILTEDSMM